MISRRRVPKFLTNISTIKNCDKIIVLYSGEIIEEGTHDELIIST